MKASELKQTKGCWWLNGIWGYRCNSRVKEGEGPYCPMHNKIFNHCEEVREGYEHRKVNNRLTFSEQGGLRRLLRRQLGR